MDYLLDRLSGNNCTKLCHLWWEETFSGWFLPELTHGNTDLLFSKENKVMHGFHFPLLIDLFHYIYVYIYIYFKTINLTIHTSLNVFGVTELWYNQGILFLSSAFCFIQNTDGRIDSIFFFSQKYFTRSVLQLPI